MSPHRILIVEDQREVSRLLRSTVETLEYKLEVVEIPSGEEAILYSSRKRVDLLVSDYRLPGMTGIELMHKVLKNQPEAKIILVTGQTDPEIRKEVAEAGADAFFIKPIPMADFLDAVVHHLDLAATNLPPESSAADGPEVQHSLPDLLAGLLQKLGATAIILLNDNSRILARAGDSAESENEVALIASLLSMQNSGQKVSRLIGQKTVSNWYVFDGGKYDLVFAPVGSRHSMLVIGKGIAAEDQLTETVEIFSSGRKNIEKAIRATAQSPSATQEPVATQLKADEKSKKELTRVFKDAKKILVPSEVNEFWNKAADNQKAPSSPDTLSYDQAKKLGLTPEDKS